MPVWIGYKFFEIVCYMGLKKPSGSLSLDLRIKGELSHGLHDNCDQWIRFETWVQLKFWKVITMTVTIVYLFW